MRSHGVFAAGAERPGEATASYIADQLQRLGVAASRLACGIPMGMDIRYADEYTLAHAIWARQKM